MKPDVIITWPRDIDYPAFIKRLNRDRALFGKVIIALSDGSPDISSDIISKIKDPTVISPVVEGGKDWRNVAVNEALKVSDSDYVLFLEQDFFVEDRFFEKLLTAGEKLDTIGWLDGSRLHPSCLLVKREVLNKTDKDFSAYPPEDDHFARVTKQLMLLGSWNTLSLLEIDNWYHMASLTFNIRLEREKKPVQYRPDEYKLYKLLSELI